MRKILFLFALLVPGIALAAQSQMVRLTRFEGKPIVGVAASGSFNVELIRSDRTYAVVEVNAEYEDILLFELDGRGVVTVGFRTNAPLRFENNLVCRARIYLPHPEFIHGSGAASIACSGGFESNALQIELNGAAKLNGPEIAVTGEVNLQCSGASRMTDAAINCRELNGILNGASKADIREFSGNLFCDISGASRIRMAGNAGIADIKASGASIFDVQQLSSRDCRIEASSASKVNTGTVLGDLTANGNSASSITYKGDPTIRSITISSASSIKKAL